MQKLLRTAVFCTIVIGVAFGAVAVAVSTPLPTEFTSGGVRWGDLTGDTTGFYNTATTNCSGDDSFAMGDAKPLATAQTDAFDDAGMVNVADTLFVLPGGASAPVDLSGTTLTTPSVTTGPLDVTVQWQGAGTGTIRELVTLKNPAATDLVQDVVIESNLGSDQSTVLQAASTGDISGYPTNARWFATTQGESAVPTDPPIVSVATGPGSVQSPATIFDCPESNVQDSGKAKDQDQPADTDAPLAAADENAPAPDDAVVATGTALNTDQFGYRYSVSIPAGQTRYLMVFWNLVSTKDEVLAAGPAWNTNPSSGSEALAGISPLQLSQIVNWAFPLEIAPRFTG